LQAAHFVQKKKEFIETVIAALHIHTNYLSIPDYLVPRSTGFFAGYYIINTAVVAASRALNLTRSSLIHLPAI
jgi:UDP-N-acetylmuramyl pentapeptide phosphotransferase/UDP-N-acetylglucosamine-1-phosphate transferase